MSDVMLHGVLNMPPELWSGSPIDVMQRHSRYLQASQYIDELTEQRDEAREETIRTREFMDHGFAKAREQLAAVTEQRDRLAEAVNAATILIAARGRHNTMLAYEGLRDTLQSLKQSTEL
jgi:DNA-binding TFAR19-related protein (PDSD5 family)